MEISIFSKESDIYSFIDWMLKEIIRLKFPPTIASRYMYIISTLMYVCYSYTNTQNACICKEFNLVPLNIDDLSLYRMLLYYSISYFYKQNKYNIDTLSLLYEHNSWPIKLEKEKHSDILMEIETFLTIRDGDKWKDSFQGVEYANQSQTIKIKETQDLNTYLSNPSQWTPLEINSSVQTYLTPKWGEVDDILKNHMTRYNYKQYAYKNFPSEEERKMEIKYVTEIYNSMTEKEQMIAEYYACGNGTVTPPGLWNIYAIYATSPTTEVRSTFEFFYVLNMLLFQVSIVVWDIKLNFKQSRPIQDIRRWYDTLSIYNGIQNVNGSLWTSLLSTPPFPDFISGHSTFSSAAASLFTFYKLSLPDSLIISSDHLKMISPLFKNDEERSYSKCDSIYINKRSSTLNPNKPTCLMRLTYQSWDEIAEDAGKSRIYGGIHTESSNIIGNMIGKQITRDILSYLGLL